ncbi:plexin-B1 isoform X3 [Rhinichthys klamathensis goyatoka]|uniref:plexin-B1 isoform X3 n=1 Tax=Rhinichthys klamathensis goyatoka TaxID=3034132 RepID=UPI0024B4BCF2|nr:plexin-B1 isoform X3 [Rhinichthys klamathensis goyatoka]
MSDKCVFAVQCGMALILTLLQSLILGVLGVHSSYPRFSSNNTVFQHLALHPDPSVGTVYVGARDHLFQLAGLDGLRLELDERTGPVRDSKDCLPPVTLENCPQAGLVSNHNKLLLVDPYSLQLITCGSVHQGTCQKRSLANVNQVLFSAERPVDTQYVAANDPTASTVGLVVRPQDKDPVLYVGRGYTSGHPPVSTRQLLAEPVFSYEETAKLAVAGRLSEYDHNFFATFARRNHVYFLFYRRDLKAPSREFRTYVARVCLDDQAYYSYVEVPLMCHSGSPRRNYNFLQGAQVGGEESRDSQVLMGVFSTAVSAANGPSEESALCVYSLDEVDHAIDATRDLCYTQYGDKDGNKVAYIEYDVKSNCANLPTNTLNAYPCGSDHTPSPMASREPVVAEAVLDSPSARLTAVAVSVKEGHTIVFLGDSKGNLHKVFLGNSGEVKKYSTLLIQPGLAINSDLLLDSTHRHVYIMTSHSVEKRPVAECDKHTDCTSCLAVKDPYCGWCVLDGRCGMRSDCRLGSVEGHWLWSFDEQQQCLKVESLSRYNASLGEQKLIAVDVLGLPSLSEGDMYSCFFEDTETAASVQGSTVTCATPEAHRLPPVQQGEDSVSVTLSLRFQTVTVAGADFTFYDCSVVQQLSGSMPCSGCVNSRWKCNWCIHQHVCTHRPTCDRGAIIYNQNDEESLLMSRGSHACPCVESIQGSSLLPVNVARKITLVGRNLHLYQDKDLDYQCVLVIEGRSVVVDAYVEVDDTQPSLFFITCQLHQYSYSAVVEEYSSMISVRRRDSFQMDYPADLHVRLYNCSVGRSDCSRCHTADREYGCVWCEGSRSSCVFKSSCTGRVQQTCPAPHIHTIEPLSGPVEGGTVLTVSGSNLGQRAEDIQQSVTVAGVPCTVIPDRYEVSSSIVCETTASARELSGHVSVQVKGGGIGQSAQRFRYQDPVLLGVSPLKGPMSGGTSLTITGQNLLTGRASEISILIGGVPCHISPEQYNNEHFECVTGGSNRTGESGVTVRFGRAQRHLQEKMYHYTPDPNVTHAAPSKSFLSGGRIIRVSGQHLDVVQEPRILVTLTPLEKKKKRRRRSADPLRRERRIVPEPNCPEDSLCVVKQVEFTQVEERCTVNSSSLILCLTPEVGAEALHASVSVRFLLDNLHFEFEAVSGSPFIYEPNPVLHTLNQNDPSKPFRHKPGSIISVEGENLDLAMSKEEVAALIGDGECAVKTLTRNHLYCEPPTQQPTVAASKKREAAETLPDFTVRMGNLNFSLGRVQYDSQGPAAFPLEAQVGVGVGASIVALIVLVIVLIYRRKSKQALRDYKKVQIQLENLETSVRDRCKKEFTDLMTEMMDVSSDLMGSGIPFLDYRKYSERIFFPGHRDSPLRRDLDVPACRRATVEQGLVQLSNLLNSKLFLTKFIHTLEAQRTFSPRDRAYVASLLTVALHGKLEYFTDILKTLLSHLVEQYTTKNPKLMLRRTESVVEKLLTNWMSICLYTFLRDTAGEAFYMLFRAIKHQVDKGPVDAVSGKAKYTLNDNRLLREDVEYRTLTLNVLVTNGGAGEPQTVPTKVLDCDTITQVKEKIVEQTCKGMSYTQRPSADSVHLEWRAGTAGHLILSDQDLTSVVQGSWKRLNTLQHYKVPDGATVTLVSRQSKQIHHDSQDYIPGEKTPMLDDGDEGGVKQWHLVKANEEAELPKHRRGSLRDKERERAKAIPEIYLTRLLSVKGTLQKFVDDLFTVILSTSQPVPMAVKYFFDLLDDQATQHNITDPETIHIWKTNSLPLRFWINILKNPQFIFDVQASDNVDAVLSVIAQTFMDSCTIADHKLGRDSPINKLLYARDIPRYKQMVERYYSDIRQTIPVSDQEMNSSLAELSRNYSNEVNHLVALHELYKYINKYYDQIITALEEDSTAQKMQLGYRLQQIAAAVENKVTDL